MTHSIFIFLAFVVSLSAGPQAFGALKPNCGLYLISSVSESSMGRRATPVPDSLRALYFLKNLKRLGFHASRANAIEVREELEIQSEKNLHKYLENFNQWLLKKGIYEHHSIQKNGKFLFWKEQFSPSEGIFSQVGRMDSESQREVSSNDHISFWSEFAGLLDGVSLNLEELDSSPEKLVQSSSSNGIARMVLNSEFSRRWMFVLPSPGESFGFRTAKMMYSYLGFLSVFAPADLRALFRSLKFYLPSELSLEDLGQRSFLDAFALMASTESGRHRLHLALRIFFRGQVLTIEDAEKLLLHVKAQMKGLQIENEFVTTPFAYLNNLVAYVSGPLGKDDYVMFERPFVPPTLSSPRSRIHFGTPGLEGDRPPEGPVTSL